MLEETDHRCPAPQPRPEKVLHWYQGSRHDNGEEGMILGDIKKIRLKAFVTDEMSRSYFYSSQRTV